VYTDLESKALEALHISSPKYCGAGKSLARPTSPYILFDGENI